MDQDKSKLQTILITQLLAESPKKEDFDGMVVNDYQTSTLIIKLHYTAKNVGTVFFPITQSKMTVYSTEKSTFGKGIRLLLQLDKQYGLLTWCRQQGVDNIIATTVKNPNEMNKSNHFMFSTDDLKPLFKELHALDASHRQAYELAVNGLIAQNQH